MDPILEQGVIKEDTQSLMDERNIGLDQVGICDLNIPLTLGGCERNKQTTQTVSAVVDLSVNLSPERKGIHMSRLIETMLDADEVFSIHALASLLEDLRDRQEAERARIEVSFDYFFSKQAPCSGIAAPQAYRCYYAGSLSPDGLTLYQGVEATVKTLCPCSKAISDYGAHNQRGKVRITVAHDFEDTAPDIGICLEELIEIAENGASSPLYPVLKRVDERFVTMSAYDKPCFVEDVVRNVAMELQKEQRFSRYAVKVVNYESIHNHNAFASIQRKRGQGVRKS